MSNGHGDRIEVVAPTTLGIDTIRALVIYALVLIVVVGGGAMLYAIRLDPATSGSATLSLAIVGMIGSALQFAWGQEVQTRTARQAAASTAASTAAQTAQTAAANSGVGGVSPAPPPPPV